MSTFKGPNNLVFYWKQGYVTVYIFSGIFRILLFKPVLQDVYYF